MMKQRGFSLIEVVVSIFVVGVMLLLLQAVTRNNVLVRNVKNQGIALAIARNEIEALRTGGYASVPASGTFADSLMSSLPSGATTTLTTSDYNAKTKQVVATVTWKTLGYSASTTVSVTTLITQAGGLP